MNVQSEFDSLYSLLKQNASREYANEILREIEESEVLFHPQTKLEVAHVLRIYSDRFAIQKGVTKHDIVEGYESLIDKLQREISDQLCIFKLTGVKITYTVFTSTSIDQIIGILKSKDRGIEKMKEMSQLHKEKKLTVSSRRFYKKILQSD